MSYEPIFISSYGSLPVRRSNVTSHSRDNRLEQSPYPSLENSLLLGKVPPSSSPPNSLPMVPETNAAIQSVPAFGYQDSEQFNPSAASPCRSANNSAHPTPRAARSSDGNRSFRSSDLSPSSSSASSPETADGLSRALDPTPVPKEHYREPLSVRDRARLERVVGQLKQIPVLQALTLLEPVLPEELYQKLKTTNPYLLFQAAALITTDKISTELYRLSPDQQEHFLSLSVPGFSAASEPPVETPTPTEPIIIRPAIVYPEKSRWKTPAPGSVTLTHDGKIRSHQFSVFKEVSKASDHYSYIDPYIAIGDHLSVYDGFNVVVNLNYPFNQAPHHTVETKLLENQIIITVGIEDSPTEPMLDILEKVIPYLLEMKRQNSKLSVLFHCYAGISRSSTLAIAYYSKLANTSLDHTITIVATRRPQIRPNQGFMNALAAYLNAP